MSGGTLHRYPAAALRGDYMRAAAGLAVTVPALVLAPLPRWAGAVLAVLAALFAWLALRTARRQRAMVTSDDDGISCDGRRIAWDALGDVRLTWYGNRKMSRGVMEMTLRGPGARIDIDSRITGFADIARRVHGALRARAIEPGPRTRENFRALNLPLDRPPPRP